jgi:hypothetical protein
VTETDSIFEAMVRLPLAAVLGAVLAMRPRRAGTPPRRPAVVQTQIILAVVGALVMIVVGASLARAFGIVGIASLIRYRAKIEDPKDAGVMLAALGVGFWLVQQNAMAEIAPAFHAMGVLALSLGVGAIVSAGLSYVLSARLGLVGPSKG